MVDTIKFSEMTAGGDLPLNSKTPGLLSGANVLFNNPWTFLPPGITADRPTPSSSINYRLRFNTSDQLYEYYDAVLGSWVQLQENAFTAGPFVTFTASSFLPDAQNLGLLTNGILRQTITTGVATLDIAVNGIDFYGPGFTGYLESPAGIKDIYGNIIVSFFPNNIADVNYLGFFGNEAGSPPGYTAKGADTNIAITAQPKGDAGFGIDTQAVSTSPFSIKSGTGGQHTTLTSFANTAAARIVTFQDSNGTIAWLSDVAATVTSLTGTANQVLVNGTSGSAQTGAITLTLPQNIATTSSPTFNNLTLTGGILSPVDSSLVVNFSSDPVAVNYLTLASGATGQSPLLGSIGSDANVNLRLRSYGDSGIRIETTAVATSAFNIASGTLNGGSNTGQHVTQFSFANTLATRTVTFQDASGTLAFLSDIPAGSPSSLTRTNDTNITVTLGGTPSTALLQAVSLTMGWSGTLAETRGGTAQSTYTLGDILYSSAANTLSKLAGNTTSGIQYLSQTGTGVVSAAPAWATISGGDITGAALTKTDDTNVTLTLGGTPSTSLLRAASLTLGWTGTLSGTRGGTGVNNGSSTFTIGGNVAFSGAFTFTGTITGNTAVTFPTSGTLATTSQLVTPAALTKTDDTNVTLTLGGSPSTALVNAASLTLGWTGTLSGTRGGTGVNNGASTITLGGSLTTSGAFASTFTMTGITGVTFPTSGTLATTSQIPTGAALTKTDDTNVTLTLGGSPTTALVNAASLTLGWTGQLGLTRGGTAASLTASNGGIVYSTASAMAILSGTATAGQMLQSGASAAPTWSTTTYPATNAINTIMYASSANVLGSIAAANSSVLVTSAGGVPSMSTTLPNINIGTPSAGVLTNTTAGGGTRSFQVFTSGTAATYTKPANVTSILVEIVGGGGGGGGCADPGVGNVSAAGGGAGGGYASLWIAASSATYTYTVGSGGAGGVGGADGATGGTTTFSASSLQATGGGPGSQGQASASGNFAKGAKGGIGTNGNINGAGGCGAFGATIGGAVASASGGSSIYGGGGDGRQASVGVGNAGIGYGGGGGGASASNGSAQTGGAGSGGIIIVWEFS